MAAELIGTGQCVVRGCSSKKARFTLSKKGLAVCTCNSCNMQAFARSERSDEHFRACIIPDAAPVDDTPAAPPGPIVKVDDVAPPPAAPAPADPPPKKPKTFGWGILAGLEQ